MNIGWNLNDAKKKRNKEINFRWNVGWHRNDGKPYEARMNIDKAQDGMKCLKPKE